MRKQIVGVLKDFAVILSAYFLVTTLAYASYHIPSESMVPTLEVGDRLLVNKFTYGYSRYSVPLHPPTGQGRLFADPPDRGDVVVFHAPSAGGGASGVFGRIWQALRFSPENEVTFIKRVIGLPGDTVQMRGGRLFINGEMVPRRFVREVRYRDRYRRLVVAQEYEETLPGGPAHRIFEIGDRQDYDDTRLFTVPPGHYFMMGDNRDNSTDSRAPQGFLYVSADRLIGRADLVTFSIARCSQPKGIDCVIGIPFERFFDRIR